MSSVVLMVILVLLAAVGLMPGWTPGMKRGRGLHDGESIASLEKLTIGNSEQWVLIRSENTSNPILLFLHGGPGTSELTLNRKNTRALERYFTIVNWDQRGAGKSYAAIGDRSRMVIDQFVSDTVELTQHLERRFGKKKITLVGHSWGTAIGVLAVAKRPDLFNGYIGIGQMSEVAEGEKISYEWTLQQAGSAKGVKDVKKLMDIGPPPYTGDWRAKFMSQRRILGKYGGEYYVSKAGAFGVVFNSLILSTEYTLMDRVNYFRGIFDSVKILFPQLLKVNLFGLVPELDVPVWFMLGRHDYEVPSVLSENYFNALKAPSKELIWFEKSAHLPNTEERDLFNKILIDEILPVVRADQ
jgi:pimeloyl-ACP methyl ester carboxylesterase